MSILYNILTIYVLFAAITAITSIFTVTIPAISYIKNRAKLDNVEILVVSSIITKLATIVAVSIGYFIFAPFVIKTVVSGMTDKDFEKIYSNQIDK